jgi:hypothetical protein
LMEASFSKASKLVCFLQPLVFWCATKMPMGITRTTKMVLGTWGCVLDYWFIPLDLKPRAMLYFLNLFIYYYLDFFKCCGKASYKG